MIYPAPRAGREATPHWRAAREGRLVMPYCPQCRRFIWPPPAGCPTCRSQIEWRECAGSGEVVTFSIVRRAVHPEWQDAVPYAVAIIALDEGVRLMSNIVDCDVGAIRCGLRVRCRFVPTTDPELGLPVFAPDSA